MAFNITREAYEKLVAANRYDLILIAYVNESGYAGILSNGNIVDRRIFQEAIPIPENAFMGIPKSKNVVSHEQQSIISDLEARLKEAVELIEEVTEKWISASHYHGSETDTKVTSFLTKEKTK